MNKDTLLRCPKCYGPVSDAWYITTVGGEKIAWVKCSKHSSLAIGNIDGLDIPHRLSKRQKKEGLTEPPQPTKTGRPPGRPKKSLEERLRDFALTNPAAKLDNPVAFAASYLNYMDRSDLGHPNYHYDPKQFTSLVKTVLSEFKPN